MYTHFHQEKYMIHKLTVKTTKSGTGGEQELYGVFGFRNMSGNAKRRIFVGKYTHFHQEKYMIHKLTVKTTKSAILSWSYSG